MEFKLKFTYSTELVFDYLRNEHLTIKKCISIYGEEILLKAMRSPGMIVENTSNVNKSFAAQMLKSF